MLQLKATGRNVYRDGHSIDRTRHDCTLAQFINTTKIFINKKLYSIQNVDNNNNNYISFYVNGSAFNSIKYINKYKN